MTEAQVLADLGAGKINAKQAAVLLEKAREKPLKIKISEKGGISVYNLQRFPVTLYGPQWERVATVMPEILALAAEIKAASEEGVEAATEAA